MRVLVTGSSGRIGGAIAARLALRHRVIGFDLRPGPLTSVVGDICDTRLLALHCADVDAVVHTAALHMPDLPARTAEDFRRINVDATRQLLRLCFDAGIRRFVYTSTTSLYGDAMVPAVGAAVWVTEDLVPRPRDIYDESKLAAEQACAAASSEGLACVCLRMSRCFDEEPRHVAIYRLYRGVDADDVAQAHELALDAPSAGFRVYNISAPPPFTEGDCPRLFTDAAGLLVERFPWVQAEFARRGWQLPRSIDRVYVVDRAIRELGYRPEHDFESMFRRQGLRPAAQGGR